MNTYLGGTTHAIRYIVYYRINSEFCLALIISTGGPNSVLSNDRHEANYGCSNFSNCIDIHIIFCLWKLREERKRKEETVKKTNVCNTWYNHMV